jgi:hypothetical protein
MVAFAPPSLAQDDAPAEPAAEQVDGTDDTEATEAEADPAVEEATDTGLAAADDPDAAMEDVVLEEEPSPWSGGLMMSIAAMCIGGFSAVLGIWVDRDTSRPTVFAYSMSFLILCALVVGVAQSYLDEVDGIKKDQDLERMLDMTYEIAVASGDPELIKLVEKTSGVKIDLPEPAPEPAVEEAPTPTEDGDATDGDPAPAE